MYYVYVLKSKKYRKIYIGCSDDLKDRLKQHNSGKVKSTSKGMPWEVRYYEAFFIKEEAFQREKKLKQNYRGWQELKKRIKKSLE